VRGEPDIDGMATLNGATLQVLVWNYHDDLVAAPTTPVHLAIKVPPSFGTSVKVSDLRVDESHGDAYTVWVSQGMPTSPSAAERLALQQAMEPAPLAPNGTLAVSASGFVDLEIGLPRFGVSLLTLTPTTGPSDAGADTGCACRSGGGGAENASSWALFALLGAIFAFFRRLRAQRAAAGTMPAVRLRSSRPAR